MDPRKRSDALPRVNHRPVCTRHPPMFAPVLRGGRSRAPGPRRNFAPWIARRSSDGRATRGVTCFRAIKRGVSIRTSGAQSQIGVRRIRSNRCPKPAQSARRTSAFASNLRTRRSKSCAPLQRSRIPTNRSSPRSGRRRAKCAFVARDRRHHDRTRSLRRPRGRPGRDRGQNQVGVPQTRATSSSGPEPGRRGRCGSFQGNQRRVADRWRSNETRRVGSSASSTAQAAQHRRRDRFTDSNRSRTRRSRWTGARRKRPTQRARVRSGATRADRSGTAACRTGNARRRNLGSNPGRMARWVRSRIRGRRSSSMARSARRDSGIRSLIRCADRTIQVLHSTLAPRTGARRRWDRVRVNRKRTRRSDFVIHETLASRPFAG